MRAPAPAAPTRVAVDACCFVGNRTGVGNYVGTLLEVMCELHPEVSFFAFSNETCTTLHAKGIHRQVSTPRRRGPIWQNTQLVDMVRAENIDVLWGTNGVIPLRGLGRTGTVVTIHDLVHHFAPATQLPMIRWKQRVFQPLCARAADRVVAVSQSTADDIQSFYRRKTDAVIHPLAGTEFNRAGIAGADATLRELDVPAEFILCVGTLEPRKNIAAMIEAYAGCLDAGTPLPVLVLVGSRGWFDGALQGLMERLSARGALRYPGYIANEKLAHLYARCAMLVMPSLYEGFGMPILEAQACGAPVVYGPHASMAEAAGEVGIRVDGSVSGLRSTLEAFARGELPLACRRPEAIHNDARAAAERMWGVMVDSWRSRQRATR